MASESRLAVVAAPPRTPDFDAVQATLAGARRELARWGHGAQQDYPRLVIELVRVEELAAGISVNPERATPSARGLELAVTARAWIQTAPDAAPSQETGDITRTAQVAATDADLPDIARHGSAVRAAASAVGSALARSALGLPVADALP